MSVHSVVQKSGVYFITFTCYDWLPLIDLSDGYGAVYRFLGVLKSKGHQTAAYVIMPNHLHLLLHYTGQGGSLNSLIGNGKRFMAYEMIRSLEQKGKQALLQRLQVAVPGKDRARGQKHSFWKETFDVKECRTEKFVLQKLNYLHNNPLSGKWKLADSPLDYTHSSAPFYYNGRQPLFEVVDYRELLDWEKMYE